jgi:ABC-2 type transport system permease protein
VVFGETLGRFGVAMVQGLFIVLASAFLFDVDWGDPLGAAALAILFALVATGAGLLLGTLLQNQQQAASIGVFAGLGLAALGGCMVPLEVFPETMRRVAHLTPHAWALDGFAELIRRGGTLADILPELGMLAVYAAALLSVATWRFHRSITG